MNRDRVWNGYLRFLALCYGLGFFLHLADVLDARLQFSRMGVVWKTWILYLLVFDLLAAIGLWRGRGWGVGIFLMIAVSQLVAYLGFREIFGDQSGLVWFHVGTLAGMAAVGLYSRERKIALAELE